MGVIVETGATFSDVYKIEEDDEVLGGDGVDDIANKQAHALMQRTNYLLSLLEDNDSDIILAVLNSYTPNDLILLKGCIITATVPGSSSITAGSIYYNGKRYKVPAATVVTTSGQTLVFKIDTSINPNQIYLTNATSGTGIANYNDTSVKSFHLLLLKQVNLEVATAILLGLMQSYTTNDLISLWGGAATINIPGSSTIDEAYVYYNGIFYYLPSTTVVTTSGQTIVYKLNTYDGFNFIKAVAGTSGSGIADYNGTNVKSYYEVFATPITSGSTSIASSVSFQLNAIKRGNEIILSGDVFFTTNTALSAGNEFAVTLTPISAYIPATTTKAACSARGFQSGVIYPSSGFIATRPGNSDLSIDVVLNNNLASGSDMVIYFQIIYTI